MLPIVFTFISFIGIAASSAGQARYHLAEIPWDPNVLISHWSNRACRFFGAASFALASLGVNISANSLSAANDFAAMAPRYINIRRGQILCAILSWCLVPWKIMESAGNFLNFMAAYAIFLGPVAAIMLWDYWLVKKQKYDSLAFFQRTGIYQYNKYSINWRAIIAFVVGAAPSIPGLVESVNSHIHVGLGIHPYQIGWMLGFVGTSIVYVGLTYAFPARETLIERAVLPDEIYDARAEVVEGVEAASGATSDEEKKVHEKVADPDAVDDVEMVPEGGIRKLIRGMDRFL